MATVLAGPRIGEHVACQRGRSKCVVKFAIAQLITNKPVTLTGYLRFPVAAGLFRSNVEHAKRLWFTRDHLAMAQALGWDRVASFCIDLETPVLPSGIPKPGPLQMHLPDDHMRYAIIWFSLAGFAADRVCRLAARPYARPFLMSASGRYCCKTLKMRCDQFPAN
jgi:cytochrome oxidase assembly protein ShyY1